MTNRAKESNTADASYPSRARGASGETRPSVGSVTGTDRLRQVIVSISAAVAVLGALIGSGTFGGEAMPEASGGAFAADATPIAPGGPAFSIWSVIYAGLVAYAVWQWFPSQAAAVRHRRVGPWIAASMLLNAAWLLAVQAAWLWLTLVVMVALLVVLIVAFVMLRRVPPVQQTSVVRLVDNVVTDGTVGLYLGWIVVATVANIAAVAAEWGLRPPAPDAWAVAVLTVAALIGIALALWSRGRLAPSASICWGLVWVGVARLTGDFISEPAAWAAFVGASVLLVVTVVVRIAYRKRSRTVGVGSSGRA